MAKVLTKGEIEEIVDTYDCHGLSMCIRERLFDELIGTRQQPLYDAAIKAMTELEDFILRLKQGHDR